MSRFAVRTATLLLACLAGCGGGEEPLRFSGDVRSDRAVDASVMRSLDNVTGLPVSTIVKAFDNGVVLAGIDPASGAESRTILDFPLAGPGGVPAGSRVLSASVRLFIVRMSAASANIRVSFLLEPVGSQPLSPVTDNDFSAPAAFGVPAAFDTPSSVTGQGIFKLVDAAPLLQEAVDRGLPGFRVRIRLDPDSLNAGLSTIEDGGFIDPSPHLLVEYLKP